MTVSHLPAPARLFRRAGDESQTAAGLEWFQAGEVWVAHEDYRVAGVIERHEGAFRLSDEHGTPVGVFRTLHAAKKSLEPQRDTRLSDEIYGEDSRRQARLSGAIVLALVSFGGIAGTLLILAPL